MPKIILFLNRLTIFKICPPLTALGLLALAIMPQAVAQQNAGFAGGVTPARFELDAAPGDLLRNNFSIYNLGDRPQTFNVYTNDWSFSESGNLSFSRELADNSCRQWVRLERHTIKILPSAYKARKFRFEIDIPADAPLYECRFAIMIESNNDAYNTEIGNGVRLPTTGKIAVIVYLNVGSNKPVLRLQDFGTRLDKGKKQVFVEVVNNGNAHGRFDNELTATDASGAKLLASVSTSPIMPKQKRQLQIYFTRRDGSSVEPVFPVKIQGRLFSDGQTFDIDRNIE